MWHIYLDIGQPALILYKYKKEKEILELVVLPTPLTFLGSGSLNLPLSVSGKKSIWNFDGQISFIVVVSVLSVELTSFNVTRKKP